jgi:hypothetical protein
VALDPCDRIDHDLARALACLNVAHGAIRI